ncbi:MAG: rhodanese-like domain-containing protein [Myxococcota bacterium]
MTKFRILLPLLPLSLLLALAACASPDPRAATITPDALAERIAEGDAPLVLDVRSQSEYESGHIPGAVWIPHDELASRLSELPADKDTEIVVHCQSGRRAGMAETVLGDAGYTHVVDLEGHWEVWSAGDYPKEP